jgi:hypothetical protein
MISVAIISLFPTSFIGGLSYYPKNDEYNFDELNIYLFIVQFQIRIYEKEIQGY